jgi:methyl-accepting chemotaxis protein
MQETAQSATISTKTVDEAQRTGATVQGLADAAQRIGEVVQFINDIPSQTNLQEWSDATRDIAANLQQAGAGATVASRTVAAGSETATANRAAADEMHAAAGLAEGRRGEVARFLEQVRAADRLSVPSRRL